jgi:hypothetical protein
VLPSLLIHSWFLIPAFKEKCVSVRSFEFEALSSLFFPHHFFSFFIPLSVFFAVKYNYKSLTQMLLPAKTTKKIQIVLQTESFQSILPKEEGVLLWKGRSQKESP